MGKFHELNVKNDLQFGFKEKLGCSHAILLYVSVLNILFPAGVLCLWLLWMQRKHLIE